MSCVRPTRVVEAAGVLLFFIQALRVVISAIFGILYDYGFEGAFSLWSVIAVGLMAATFLAPLLPTHKRPSLALMTTALLTATARPIMNIAAPMPRYWSGLVILAAGSAYLATLIRSEPQAFIASLVGALTLDQALRALGNTFDLSIRPEFLSTQVAFSLGLIAWAVWLFLMRRQPASTPGRLKATGGLAMGAGLFVLTSLLTLPNAIAQWSDFEYAAIAPTLAALTCAPLFPHIRTRLQSPIARKVGLAGALLGLTIGYQRWGIWSALGLLIAYTALLTALLRTIETAEQAQPNRTGAWLAAGLLLVILFNLAVGFTFTYPYTLRWMRGMGLPVYLIAGLLAASAPAPHAPSPHDEAQAETGIKIFVLCAAVVVLIASFPAPVSARSNSDSITTVSYTIRYGFDNSWHYVLEDIARAIEQSGADIVLLQEADTGRLTSLGTDDVYYLARRLQMDAFYLPTVERLTGIAVLSRLPVVSAEGRLITSRQEQTGVAHVQLSAAGRDLHVYSTWLGVRGEDTRGQIAEVVSIIGDRSPAVLGGAFFTEPGSNAYAAINDAGFDFAAFGLGAPSPHIRATNPAPHTDYIYLRGLTSLRGWLPRTPPTNHKLVAVQFAAP